MVKRVSRLRHSDDAPPANRPILDRTAGRRCFACRRRSRVGSLSVFAVVATEVWQTRNPFTYSRGRDRFYLAFPMIDLSVPPISSVTERGRGRRRVAVLATAAFAVMIAGGAGYALLRPTGVPVVADSAHCSAATVACPSGPVACPSGPIVCPAGPAACRSGPAAPLSGPAAPMSDLAACSSDLAARPSVSAAHPSASAGSRETAFVRRPRPVADPIRTASRVF